MIFQDLHTWNVAQPEALVIQSKLRGQIQIRKLDGVIEKIGAVDTVFDQESNLLIAAACVFSYPDLEVIEQKTASAKAKFPYIPGLHVFREGPVILKALEKLATCPDLILFSGHGIAHPRKIGLASHIGLITDIPSIGCARKKLVGYFQNPGMKQGDYSDLLYDNARVGIAYRSRENIKPIFISPGHLCDVSGAGEIVTRCISRYRMPEPLRAAHKLVGERKREL
ncbi:MAG: endonuclease V [candidate division Zixibacteria bacterium]